MILIAWFTSEIAKQKNGVGTFYAWILKRIWWEIGIVQELRFMTDSFSFMTRYECITVVM